MRQLFRNLPPRIVSRKCVRQSSDRSTLAMAAAIPPSAITVCALPSNDLHTTPTLAPCANASIAARADDQNIVFVSFVLFGHNNLKSVIAPEATRRTYRSASPTENRLNHAKS